MTARILEVTPSEYHKLPQFSSTLAKVLITKSPAHAWDAHLRRLEQIEAEDESDDDVTDEKRKRLENGTIQHAMQLGRGGERIKVIPADLLGKNGAYSTNVAKAARDEARAAGLIPIKEHEVEIHQRVARAIGDRIAAAGHTLDGTSELAIAWTEPAGHDEEVGNLVVECRAMLDHVVIWGASDVHGPTRAIIYDLKIVGDAHPDRCERTAENLGYAIQAAAYTRALNALYPTLAGRIDFRFLFVEGKRPYEIWDPSLSGPFREIGERRWLRAVRAWEAGLRTGRWPGYRTPDRVEISAPMWTLRQEGFTSDEL